MASNANYQVLARRYRPQLFRDVIGQQAVVQMLHNEITEGRVGHGYLFCGPRGTGKTSMARIFAKALNCEKGPTTEPCGKCSHCLEIAAGTHLDIIEIDAATYTKVEDMRLLLEGIGRAPFSAKYKVYIIDEVHMLSNSSFNALLKSLEEPPPRVIFILATTNPEKIPETVRSRCRRCNFERIAMNDLIRSLSGILDREKVNVAADERQAILNAIALASDGGLRDAQVLLDQLISLAEDELTLDTVRSLLGVVEGDLFTRLLKSLVEHNTQDCLLLIGDLVDRGRDLQRFVKMFLGFLRDAMILKAGASPELLRIADPASDELKATIDKTTLPFLLNAVQQFLDLEERMRGAAPPRFLLEFALIKLTAIDPRLVIENALGGVAQDQPPLPPSGGGASRLGARPASAPPTRPTPARGKSAPGPNALAQRPVPVMNDSAVTTAEAEMPAPAIEAIHTSDSERWPAFVEYVAAKNPGVRGIMAKARLSEIMQNRLHIQIAAADRAMFPLLDRPEMVHLVREAAAHVWKRPLMPRFTLESATPMPVVESSEDWPSAPVIEMEMTPRAPVPPAPRPKSPPIDVRHAMTFQQALNEFPQFREACELMEQHFGMKPVAFNGKRI